jgi:hypothetical protein
MRGRVCSGCVQILPARVVNMAVTINGRRYLTCSVECRETLLRLHVAVRPEPDASDAFAQLWNRDFGPVKIAPGTTAVAERAEQNTLALATRTARIGRAASRRNQTPAALTRLTYCRNNDAQAQACPVVACPCCEGRGVAVRCDACNGTGMWVIYTERESIQAHVPRTIRCETCAGRGYVPVSEQLLKAQGFRP